MSSSFKAGGVYTLKSIYRMLNICCTTEGKHWIWIWAEIDEVGCFLFYTPAVTKCAFDDDNVWATIY